MPSELTIIRTRTFGIALILASVMQAVLCHAQVAPDPSAPVAHHTSPLPPGWDEVDQRMVFLTVQLSTVESTMAATEKSLRVHGYQQAARQAAADQAIRGNQRMDRNGGGPVPWQEFYGWTAAKFFYHPADDSTIYVNPDAVAQRPPQFDYIYRANEQSADQAEEDVQKIGDKIDDLLAYRRQLEAEQSALWGKIAFRGDSSLDIASRPLYRMDEAASGNDDANKQAAEAANAGVAFMLAINAEVADAEKNLSNDQEGAFDRLLETTSSARDQLKTRLLSLPALAASVADPRTALGQFTRAAGRLEDSAQNIVDAYRLAADCDSKDDQASKQIYRGQLQQMIFDYASTFVTADQTLGAAVAGWKLRQVAGVRAVSTSAPNATTAGDDIAAQLDGAKIAHERIITTAHRALEKILDARLDAAADAGDLGLVQSLAAAKITVARDGTLPDDIKDATVLGAQSESQKSIAAANQTLIAAYHAAIVSYTRARRFTDAQAAQDELNAFLADPKVTNASAVSADGAIPSERVPPAAGAMPSLAPGKILHFTRTLPANWQYDGSMEVRSDGIVLPETHYIRSAQANFLDRDFTLDLWLTVDPKNPTAFIGVGSGQNGEHGTPVNSIFMVVHPDGGVTMSTREGYGDSGMGKEEDPGEYMVRLEKKGTSVTFSIGSEDKNGVFVCDITQTFPDISKTPANFTDRNMHIFFGGGQYRQMRFTSSAPREQFAGSVDSPLPAAPNVLTLGAVLPPYLECATSYSATPDGLMLPVGHFIRTRQGNFLHRDFVFDVWLTVDDKMEAAIIGLGSGMDDQGGTPSNSVEMIVERRRPHLNGRSRRSSHQVDAGQYIVRIEKKGVTVTYSIGAEQNGAFEPDFTETIPDISKTPEADFNSRNMHIFFGSGTYQQMRLTVSPTN